MYQRVSLVLLSFLLLAQFCYGQHYQERMEGAAKAMREMTVKQILLDSGKSISDLLNKYKSCDFSEIDGLSKACQELANRDFALLKSDDNLKQEFRSYTYNCFAIYVKFINRQNADVLNSKFKNIEKKYILEDPFDKRWEEDVNQVLEDYINSEERLNKLIGLYNQYQDNLQAKQYLRDKILTALANFEEDDEIAVQAKIKTIESIIKQNSKWNWVSQASDLLKRLKKIAAGQESEEVQQKIRQINIELSTAIGLSDTLRILRNYSYLTWTKNSLRSIEDSVWGKCEKILLTGEKLDRLSCLSKYLEHFKEGIYAKEAVKQLDYIKNNLSDTEEWNAILKAPEEKRAKILNKYYTKFCNTHPNGQHCGACEDSLKVIALKYEIDAANDIEALGDLAKQAILFSASHLCKKADAKAISYADTQVKWVLYQQVFDGKEGRYLGEKHGQLFKNDNPHPFPLLPAIFLLIGTALVFWKRSFLWSIFGKFRSLLFQKKQVDQKINPEPGPLPQKVEGGSERKKIEDPIETEGVIIIDPYDSKKEEEREINTLAEEFKQLLARTKPGQILDKTMITNRLNNILKYDDDGQVLWELWEGYPMHQNLCEGIESIFTEPGLNFHTKIKRYYLPSPHKNGYFDRIKLNKISTPDAVFKMLSKNEHEAFFYLNQEVDFISFVFEHGIEDIEVACELKGNLNQQGPKTVLLESRGKIKKNDLGHWVIDKKLCIKIM